jgi:hypothetical protein
MKTIEIKLYKFNELSDEAKNTVLERHRDINVDYEWWDTVYYGAENIGIIINTFDIGRASYCNCEFLQDATWTANKIIEDVTFRQLCKLEREDFVTFDGADEIIIVNTI